MYRTSCEATLWACLRDNLQEWRATELYHELETSEKSAASYRLGTVMAAAVSDLVLDIPITVHRETLFGKSSGQRGDLVGMCMGTSDWHGIEAKGKSPVHPSGDPRYVSPADYAAAKDQARSLASDLLSVGAPTGPEHWAITTRTSTHAMTEVVLDDPPAEEGNGPPASPGGRIDFPHDDPVERMLQGFYQVAADIDAIASTQPAGVPAGLRAGRRGDWVEVNIPRSDLWLGADRTLIQARRAGRLRGEVGTLTARPEPMVEQGFDTYDRVGLAVTRQSRHLG
jgi:hypothetical protein